MMVAFNSQQGALGDEKQREYGTIRSEVSVELPENDKEKAGALSKEHLGYAVQNLGLTKSRAQAMAQELRSKYGKPTSEPKKNAKGQHAAMPHNKYINEAKETINAQNQAMMVAFNSQQGALGDEKQ